MIIGAEIITQPYSGEYREFLYDIPHITWKSGYWGWVKFINQDYSEWCGEFRGVILGVEMSERFNSVLILTTDYLYMTDKQSGEVIDVHEDHEYTQITTSPSEEYVLASSDEIVVIKDSIKSSTNIELPFGICSIKFLRWHDYQLIMTVEDYLQTGSFLKASLDSKIYKMELCDI